MTRIGGRKFLMALLVVGAAMFLEVKTANGLTPTTAGFLVAVLGAFSAANFASTAKFIDGKNNNRQPEDGGQVADKLNQVQGLLQQGLANPETLQTFLAVLGQMKSDIEQVREATGQIGKTMVNLSKRN
jgi:hypothetical protein